MGCRGAAVAKRVADFIEMGDCFNDETGEA